MQDFIRDTLLPHESYSEVLRDAATGVFVYDSLKSILKDKADALAHPHYERGCVLVCERGDPILRGYDMLREGRKPLIMCHTEKEHPGRPSNTSPEHTLYHQTTASHSLNSNKFRNIYNHFARENDRKNVSTYLPHIVFFRNGDRRLVESRIGHCALVSSHLDSPKFTRTRLNCVFDIAVRAQEDGTYIDSLILSDLGTEHPEEFIKALHELFRTYKYHFQEIRLVSSNEALQGAFFDHSW